VDIRKNSVADLKNDLKANQYFVTKHALQTVVVTVESEFNQKLVRGMQ